MVCWETAPIFPAGAAEKFLWRDTKYAADFLTLIDIENRAEKIFSLLVIWGVHCVSNNFIYALMRISKGAAICGPLYLSTYQTRRTLLLRLIPER